MDSSSGGGEVEVDRNRRRDAALTGCVDGDNDIDRCVEGSLTNVRGAK